jgi:8-oxo-dGTP pyrophosphatase MutT (NUDIX family)
VRAIIIENGKIAMVHSEKYNYYKLPGGGIEPGESKEEALVRETLEETGLRIIPESIKEYGYVLRKQKGKQEDVFIQENYYYFCQVEKKVNDQSLKGYEAIENFQLEFVNPLEAIKINRNIDHGPKDKNMVERDIRVLELLTKEKLLK